MHDHFKSCVLVLEQKAAGLLDGAYPSSHVVAEVVDFPLDEVLRLLDLFGCWVFFGLL